MNITPVEYTRKTYRTGWVQRADDVPLTKEELQQLENWQRRALDNSMRQIS